MEAMYMEMMEEEACDLFENDMDLFGNNEPEEKI